MRARLGISYKEPGPAAGDIAVRAGEARSRGVIGNDRGTCGFGKIFGALRRERVRARLGWAVVELKCTGFEFQWRNMNPLELMFDETKYTFELILNVRFICLLSCISIERVFKCLKNRAPFDFRDRGIKWSNYR